MDFKKLVKRNLPVSLKMLLLGIKNVSSYGICSVIIKKGAKLIVDEKLILNANYDRAFKQPSSFIIQKDATVSVTGDYSFFSGTDVQVFQNANLTIGSGYSNINLLIRCKEKITIGHNVMIAQNVTIFDSDFHRLCVDGRYSRETAPVTIEDNVWICSGCIILKGVTIGEGSVISAGSVVYNSIPPHCIAAGNPCQVIKRNVEIVSE